MAGVGVTIALSSSISQCANQIQALGNNWYRATAEWEQFPQQVRQLEEKLKFWEAECRNKDLSDATLKQSVHAAELLLKEEQRRLEKRDTNCGSGCSPRVCTTLFPARLGLHIQEAITALDKIPEVLALMEEGRAHTDKLVQAKSFPDRFRHDTRYVPLKISEANVYKALDSLEGPMVVLLHGGPGKGKSTLARSTVVHYNKEPRFDDVFFLNCGPNANAEDTLLQLIQRLGSGLMSTSPEGDQQNKSLRIQILKHIRALLAVQKVLIILDDVHEGEFLLEIVKVCGSQVKCLVTSQLANLCHGTLESSEFLKIEIQDIQKEDARKILASHAGLPGQEIPENLQKVADEMISQTDHNPLAIASLAASIVSGSTDLNDWQEASTYLFEALATEIKAGLFHGKYPKTFWTSTKQSIENLREDSQNLLFLIHACQGESVPEVVVEMLYKGLRLQKVRGPFSLVKSDLRDRQLIKINETIDSASSSNMGIQRSWSLHSLHKLYIQEEMREARDLSIFTSLDVKDNETTKVKSQIINETEEEKKTLVTSLCALYLDKGFASMAATNMDTQLERFNIKRRSAIQPITLLLGLPLSPTWREFEQVSTRKVFLNYIKHGVLDNANICQLLQVEATAPLMCKVLEDISFLEETCMLGENTKGLMTILVTWLVEGVDHGRQKQMMALKVLRSFASHPRKVFLVSFPGFLEGITAILQEASSQYNGNHHAQSLAARVLVNLLASSKLSNEVKIKIINDHPVVLHELVNALAKDANPSLQTNAACALGDLAGGGDEIKVQIVASSPKAISELVSSLFKEANPTLQAKAAKALARLATGPDEIRLKVVNHPMALSKLVHCLSTKANQKLQEYAALALARLATGPGKIRLKIVNHPMALSKLVHSLSEEANPILQENATWALGMLALGDYEIQVKIVEQPMAISKLVHSLSQVANPTLQADAALALGRLALGLDDIKVKIVDQPMALSKLVHSLSQVANPTLQADAALALGRLARGLDEIKVRIVDQPMALSKLVHSLSQEANPKLQENASLALGRLAMGPDEIKIKIVDQPMALSKMVHSLSEEANPKLQENVALTLGRLAMGLDEIKVKIVNHPMALSKLVHSMSEEANPTLQENATWALGRLALGDYEIQLKIVEHSMALLKLVNSLSQDANPKLQEYAARVLENLAMGADEVRAKIINYPMTLLKLAHCLSKEDNPGLQKHVASGLSNLASIEDENTRLCIKATNGIIKGLHCLLVSGSKEQWTQAYAIKAITLLDPIQGNAIRLHFALPYRGRVYANVQVGLLKEALVDCDEAHKLEQEDSSILRERCFVRAMMGDYQGALEDMEIVVNRGDGDHGFNLQERGVVKRMIGNLHGALEDLNKALTLMSNEYEVLKHRGYVKFLMEDKEGAREDADWALRIKPSHVEHPRYGKTNLVLGCSSVKYLGYKLK